MTDYRGQQFGNYQLIELLGKGGYAQVYLGEQIFLKTRAAIKVMGAPLDAEKVEQFRLEAGIIARLDHPHIIRLLDYGIEENTIPYLVMDYAPNGSLRQRHPQGMPVPPSVVIRYVQEAASALDYAHQQRLIHRDIKPENLLLGRKNQVLLSDFGIAVVTNQTRSMTTQNEVGTVGYMAPEQLRRKPRPASDQYALAVVVYEWLTGTPPFQGSPIEVAMQHLELPPPPMREPGSHISVDLERVVMRALEKHWQMRYASVRDFAIALREAYSPRPPFIRAAPAEASPDPFEYDSPFDYAPTMTPPLPGITPELEQVAPIELPAQEALRREPFALSGVPSGERQTDPIGRSSGSARTPTAHRTRTKQQKRRKVLLGLTALLLIAALSIGGLLFALETNHSTLNHDPRLANSQNQGMQQNTPASSGKSPIPTRITTPTPGSSATPGTTPTATPPGSASPTPTSTTPNLFVTPGSLKFTLHVGCLLNQAQKTLTLHNMGSANASWQATIQNMNYLSLDQTSGTLNPLSSISITVTASCNAVINTTDTITFHWNGPDILISVTISILL